MESSFFVGYILLWPVLRGTPPTPNRYALEVKISRTFPSGKASHVESTSRSTRGNPGGDIVGGTTGTATGSTPAGSAAAGGALEPPLVGAIELPLADQLELPLEDPLEL